MAEALLHLAIDAGGGELPIEEADIAEHHGQQVVEVVGNSGGELADRFEPLHLAQRRLDALALLHLAHKLTVGGGQFCGPLLHARFQLLVQPPALVLAAAAAQIGLHDTEQRRRVKRPLEQADIAQRAGQLLGGGVSLDPSAMLRQDDKGKVGPHRLRGDPIHESPRINAAKGFFGDNGELRAARNLGQQRVDVGTDVRPEPGLAQNSARDHGVAPARRKD